MIRLSYIFGLFCCLFCCSENYNNKEDNVLFSNLEYEGSDSLLVVKKSYNLSPIALKSIKKSKNLLNRFYFFYQINSEDKVIIQQDSIDDLRLISFDFEEDSYFNFIYQGDSLIFKNEESLYKTKLDRKLKDWNKDGNIDYIEYSTICEAGCSRIIKKELVYNLKDSVYILYDNVSVE